MGELLDLTVTDLKQWSYCHRIPFYRYVLPVDYKRTYKMHRGKTAQNVIEALERRRRLREYGLLDGRRLFGIFLRSERLGLVGRPDLVIVTDSACFPVDFKDTEGGARQNYRDQMAAYGLLAEEQLGKPVREGFVYLMPTDDIVRIPISAADRSRIRQYLDEIRSMVARQELPEATAVRARCAACEYRNYCADIW